MPYYTAVMKDIEEINEDNTTLTQEVSNHKYSHTSVINRQFTKKKNYEILIKK